MTRCGGFLRITLLLISCFLLQFISSVSFGFPRIRIAKFNARPTITRTFMSLMHLPLASVNISREERKEDPYSHCSSLNTTDNTALTDTCSGVFEGCCADDQNNEGILVETRYLDEIESDDESSQIIPKTELQDILTNAKDFLAQNRSSLLNSGWKLVFEASAFSLYKRKKVKTDPSTTGANPEGPTEYLVKGGYSDISAKSFLQAQVIKKFRKLWDTSTKEMSEGIIDIVPQEPRTNSNNSTNLFAARLSNSSDAIYFRSKWPWPLKDRDYVLARRCKVFDDDNAVVFASKSCEVSR
jgi:hypothetical protein